MIWQGEGFVIGVSPQAEYNLLITLFSKDKGIFKTIIKGGKSKKKYLTYQLGNLVEGVWKARLEEHLGFFEGSVIKNYSGFFLVDKQKTLILKSITDLLSLSIKDNDFYQELYDYTKTFLDKMIFSAKCNYQDYILYEIEFLKYLGFAFDLSKCAVTGEQKNLYYISPKTGHSVTKEVGKKYHNQLFVIPSFLRNETDENDLKNSFELTDYFIKKHLINNVDHKKYNLVRDLLKNSFLSQ